MAIFAVGAYYNEDVSNDFIENNIAGPGWTEDVAPELHQFISSMKVGDIIYLNLLHRVVKILRSKQSVLL